MKLNLKYQLCGLVSLTALFAVGLLAIVTWFNTLGVVNELRSARLEVVASLKAKELTQALLVFLTAARSLAARVTIANSLAIPQNSSSFNANWTAASRSLSIVLSTYSDVLFVAVQNTTLDRSYLNITSSGGYQSLVGDPNAADNTTYVQVLDALGVVAGYNSVQGPPDSIASLIPVKIRGEVAPSDITADGLFLGPMSVQKARDNTPIYVASLTVPVFNNTTALPSTRNVLGYMTVVFNIHALVDVANETLGLGQSGQVLLIGPNNRLNRWNNQSGEFNISRKTDQFKYVLPPANDPQLAFTTDAVSSFPTVFRAWSGADARGGISGVDMDTRDAAGTRVAIGYSTVNFDPTNSSFLLLAEQSRTEAFEPVYKLRRIVLGTAFGAIGVILAVTYPMAAFSVRPIRRLHEATKLCGRPPEYREEPKERWWWPRKRFPRITGWVDDNASECASQSSSGRRDNFRIPQKVPIRKHFITDELTALSATFNAMTEELLEQYEGLEEKVRLRTEELQQQTVLAESANEAKTMFIANVSHELRTPLNGILGMCNLVLEENSLPARSRENLEVVSKSGELLLHLLTDLLTFSKNQVWGAQVKLEPVPFKVREFVSQIMALFDNQARERHIELTCEVSPTDSMDVMLVGDLNRILQVVINLVSNALKFTNENGSVQLQMVMDTLPNADTIDMTPYTEASEKPDYMSSPIFKESYIARQQVADAQRELDEQQSVAPSSPLSPSVSPEPGSSPQSSPKPTRPPLFTSRSTTSGVISTGSNTVNPENDITKALLTRSKKFLNPETAAAAPQSRPQTPDSGSFTTHYVEFRVIDTGPGVSEHMQSKIFEPFVQGDVGLSRKYGGTGLGLSICQQLAKLMGGDIYLKSFEGAGSTFTLRMPLRFAPSSMVLASPTMPSRPLSTDGKSARATTKSLSAFSGPAFSGRSVQASIPSGQEGKMRLVGLSQPFFVSSRQDNEDDLHGSPPSPDDAPQPGKNMPSNITAITEVTTPGTDEALPRDEFLPSHEAGHPETGNVPESELKVAKKKTTRVLVVEDNKINQNLLAKLLQLEGVDEVTVAEDGQEAVDKVKERIGGSEGTGFDIVFMDIQMPNVDGHEAARQIRGMGCTTPIVALTAFAEESNVKECFESGMDCFLSKPIKRPQIRQMIGLYCSRKKEEGGGERL